MYTLQNLIDAMRDGDRARVSEISEHFKRLAASADAAETAMDATAAPPETAPKKARKPPSKKSSSTTEKAPARTRKVSKPKARKEDLPVPSEEPSCVAPSLTKEERRTIFEPVSKLDPKDLRLITASKDDAPMRLTAAEKKAEAAKRRPRNMRMNRDPVLKIRVECDGCGREFSVFPSRLSARMSDSDVPSEQLFYVCPKCDKKPARRG